MSIGKLAAQAGHAYLDAFLEAARLNPGIAHLYLANGHGTKVCLAAPDEAALIAARDRAEMRNLPYALIIDSGHIHPPDFLDQPIVTALGLGPLTQRQARPITDRFNLMASKELVHDVDDS